MEGTADPVFLEFSRVCPHCPASPAPQPLPFIPPRQLSFPATTQPLHPVSAPSLLGPRGLPEIKFCSQGKGTHWPILAGKATWYCYRSYNSLFVSVS